MLKHHPSTEEVRGLLEPCRQLMERHLYTGLTLAPEAVTVLLNIFIVADDKLAQLGDDYVSAAGVPTTPSVRQPAMVLGFPSRMRSEPTGPGGAA